ncbi:hypothetical protein V8C34DRAFT_182046 [Trichoderma compactum]
MDTSQGQVACCRRSTTKQMPMSELRMLTDSLSACVFGESFRVVLSARGVLHGRPSASTPDADCSHEGRSANSYLAFAGPKGQHGTICRLSASDAATGCGKSRRLCRDNATVGACIYLDGGRNITRLVFCWGCGQHVSPDLARGSESHTITKCGVRRTDFNSASWCHNHPVLPTTLGQGRGPTILLGAGCFVVCCCGKMSCGGS